MRVSRPLAFVVLCGLLASTNLLASPGDCVTKGDGNGDCRIAVDDFEEFIACMTGPDGGGAHPLCACYDDEDDGDIDMSDFARLQANFTGPNLIPGCDVSAGDYEPGTRAIPPSIHGIAVDNPSRVGPIRWMAPEALRGVYLFSGEVYADAVDLHIPGRGLDFIWSRKYRSRVGPDTAQGTGWDYGYNLRIDQAGPDLVLYDGNTRADLYGAVQGPQGTIWCAPEFFREISQDPNNSYICRFPGRGLLRFHPFDASNQAGKLIAIADTNGNSMSFAYNPAGRLTTITDSLNRQITVSYNVAGRISAITDFTGRQVQYDYYGAADPDGSLGDLKSVTTPAVTGTPNGNDFPTGKTHVYTYSRGFADAALNHNLLTVTDPKGQTYSTFTYAAAIDPNQPNFDRVVRQTLGEPNDIIDFVYEPQIPDAANGYAVTLAIVNDRNGHVDEYLYDRFNRCVETRELTGQSNPDLPTSSSTNRPTNPLRPGDPPVFITRCEYNDDALIVRLIDPEQGARECIYEGDLDLFAPARSRANVRVTRYDPGPRGGDQPELVQEFEYDSLLNSDTNQATRDIDARGNDATHEYDAAGNRTRIVHRIPSIVEDFEYNTFGQVTAHVLPDNGSGHRRRDEYTYYNAGPQRGYAQSTIEDASGFALTRTFEYDAVGNVVRTVDPRGNDTLRIVNQLDQVVRTLSREPDPNHPFRYEVDNFYDENDNVVRVDVRNIDENGVLQPNQEFTTVNEYEILDNLVRTTREVDNANDIVVEYEYDANRNRTLVRSGEATNGNQPANTVTTLYDERDLVFQVVQAAGDADQSTRETDYDLNRNIVQTTSGLEDALPRVTTMTYDGYDRLTSSTDPMGNVSTLHYDANSNTVSERVDGELQDVPGGAANVRLSESTFTYDEMDRVTRSDVSYFDALTQAAIGDGLSTTTTVYSDYSQVLSATDDNSHVTTCVYDSMNRLSTVTDPKNNSRTYAYDRNSNVVSETETAKSDLGLPDEVFVSTHTFDGLDRRVSSTDSSGNQHACGYDSRGNRTLVVDALSNETRCEYDGLNRVTELVVDVDGDGADGDGTDITTFQIWDDNSRCVSRGDDNGNATAYDYDALDRPTATHSADGTSESSTFDVHDNKLTHTDANGTVVTNTYDALDRLTNRSIAVGPGVSNDTTFESYAYDGLSRKIESQDDDVIQTFTWTSMSDFLSETLNGDTTSATYDGVGNRLTLTYPSGRTIDYAYDALDRVATVEEANVAIATYQYVGSDRVARQTFGNGADTRYTYDGVQGVPNPPLDSGVKRIVRVAHAKGGSIIDDRTFTWDAMYNKTERRDVRAGGPRQRHGYSYDRTYRMTQGLVENGGGVPTRESNYILDGVGNRQQISGFGGQTGPYAMDPAIPPADFQMNQYTMTPRDNRTYDDNGNLAGAVSGPFTTVCEYDYANRLVSWENTFTGDRVDFNYDTSGRRTSKVVTTAGVCCNANRYCYGMSSEVIEERDPNLGTIATYVYGARANEIVCVEQGGTIVYHHADDQGSVMALSDPNGAVVERYEYDDYGAPLFFDGAGTPQPRSLVGNSYLFHGLRRDAETGWYLNGANYLDPINGRYIMRSGVGLWSDVRVAGNAFDYSGGNPWSAHVRGRPMKSGISGSTRGHGLKPMGHGISGSTRQRGAAMGDHPNVCQFAGLDGGESDTCYGCDWIPGSRSVAQPCPHVTILKASGVSGNHCPGCGAMLCRCKGTATRSVSGCWCGSPYSHHHGHVTVLKAHVGNGNGPGENGGIIKAAGDGNHCPGCGTMLCRCKDGPTRAAAGDHHGHVTVLKIAAPGGGNHCPGCGAMLCRCKDNATRAAGDDKKHKHKGHVTILKIAAPGGGGVGQMCGETDHFIAGGGGGEGGGIGSGSASWRCPHFFDINLAGGGSGAAGSGFKKCGCSHCNTICKHGVTETACPECPDGPIPAANNIPSR